MAAAGHMIRVGGLSPRRAGKAGFTLVEVMIAITIFVMIILASIYSLASQVAGNRMTRLRVDATSLMRAKVEELLSASRVTGNLEEGRGTAKALVYYLDSLRAQVAGKSAGYPIKITVDAVAGTIAYSFLVPDIGMNTHSIDGANDASVGDAANPLARGVITVYLDENQVPAAFRAWNDLTDSSTTPGGRPGFDMDGDGRFVNRFTGLLSGGNYATTPMISVPVRAQVSYFKDQQAYNANVSPFYEAERFFLINDGSLGRLKNY